MRLVEGFCYDVERVLVHEITERAVDLVQLCDVVLVALERVRHEHETQVRDRVQTANSERVADDRLEPVHVVQVRERRVLQDLLVVLLDYFLGFAGGSVCVYASKSERERE